MAGGLSWQGAPAADVVGEPGDVARQADRAVIGAALRAGPASACRLLGTAKLIPAVATRLLFPVVPESRGSSTRPLAANYVYVL